MSDPQTQLAIDAALKNDWQKALEINLEISEANPEDTDCLNRLGKAYLELGNTKKAIATFKQVLKINQYDPIATKNLLRASQIPASSKTNGKANKVNPSINTSSAPISFLEEPGKTKMVTLVNVAPVKILLTLRCADEVLLTAKRHTILVETSTGVYLGALPDDLGHRLLVLIKGGNEYVAFVKSVGKGLLVLFLKEKTRSKKFKNTPSFPSGNSDYLSFVREDGPADEVNPESGSDEESDDGGEITFKKSENLHQDEVQEEN